MTPHTVTRSESITKLATALSEFQGSCPTVGKTKTNPHFRSKYAGLDDIIEAIKKPLSKCGLAFVQLPGDGDLTTIIMHGESDQWIQSVMTVKPEKPNAQGLGSALTYARRYSLSSILGLAVGDEDDDGNAAVAPKAKHQPTKKLLTDAQLKVCFDHIRKGDLSTERLEANYLLTATQAKEVAAFKQSADA
jgi:hypothetical protein